jgi:hypothetical protein
MPLMRPGGLIRPNAKAIRAGLSFALDFADPAATPWIRQTAASGAAAVVAGAYNGGTARGLTRAGWAMTGTTGKWLATSGTPTYTLPTTQGTVVLVAGAATASGNPTRRYLLAVGNIPSFPASPFFGITDFDGLLYAGWANGGTDARVTTSSATGALWAAGDLFTVALTYGPSGQTLYVNGVARASNGFTNFGSTAAGAFSVGSLDAIGGFDWFRADGDAILSTLVFDHEFSPAEAAETHRDLWWWVDRPIVGRRGVASSGPTVVDLTADSIATGAPTVGTPVLGQIHALGATGVATGAPTVGTPALAQIHALQATGATTGAPTVGAPALGQAHALAAANVATGAPVVGSPPLGQTHILAAADIATGAPTVGTPSLGQSGALEAESVATGAPTVGTPTLGQTHVLSVVGLATGAPTVGTPTLAQVHALLADGIVTGAPTVGVPALNAAPIVVPASRTIRLPPRDRIATLAARDRTSALPPRRRIVTLPPERT